MSKVESIRELEIFLQTNPNVSLRLSATDVKVGLYDSTTDRLYVGDSNAELSVALYSVIGEYVAAKQPVKV